jgi:hypothetical protein
MIILASKSARKQNLETYIAQGRAMKKLLVSTNSHGKHDKKIRGLEWKIYKAQQSLAQLD